MDPLLALLQGIMQPVALIEIYSGASQKQQVPHELKTLLQTLRMLSKWQQSMSMELARTVNLSYWEVSYKQAVHDHTYSLIFSTVQELHSW